MIELPNNERGCGMVENSHQLASELMTEAELATFLRIPETSKSKDYHNVIENLRRMHGLPCIHICRQPLFPLEAVREWIRQKVEKDHRR